MPDSTFWEVSSPQEYWLLLRALPDLLPAESILYLEGAAISRDVRAFLQAKTVKPLVTIPKGTIWPQPYAYHIPITPPTMEELAEFAREHAAPEICDHLHAYHGNQALLLWYDAFFDTPFYLSKQIEEGSIKALCHTLNTSYASFK